MTISFVLLAYTGESVATTFLVTAGMFGAMALYGTTTRRSLAGFGQFLFMGLIGVVLASIVGMFWHNDGLQFVISFIGVIVFTGLAAYDAQRLKAMALAAAGGPDRLVRDRRRAGALPRLHQPVPVPAAVSGNRRGAGLAAPTALAHPASAPLRRPDRPSAVRAVLGRRLCRLEKIEGEWKLFPIGVLGDNGFMQDAITRDPEVLRDTRLPRHARSGEKAIRLPRARRVAG